MKVAIAGYGVEGEQNYKYWTKLGADVTVFDESEETARPLPKEAKTKIGKDVFSDMSGFNLVIRTASLNPSKIKTDGKIWSATNEFFAKCPAPIIGVTGTKGKGTTCSLIAEILSESGKKVHLVGNIGVPALELLPIIKSSDYVVFELSSFQLWDIEKSPETAVILMIEPDHLNIHADMDDYVMAKSNIGKYQTEEDLMIYHPTNELSKKAAQISPAKKIRYMTSEGAFVEGDKIKIDGEIICDISEVGILGVHNQENVCAAVTVSWRYTKDIKAIKKAISSFKGLPHRLEFVREVYNIKFYDDSQATGPSSCLAALRALSDLPTVLIFGGSDKGLDLSQVINELDKNMHKVVLIGESSDKLENQLSDIGFSNYINLGSKTTMAEIVNVSAKLLQNQAGNVLLSPAHASFDMFKSYQDRGDQFKLAVSKL